MKKCVLLLALLFTAFALHCEARKMALLIGVGDYPQYSDHSGWGKINSANDVVLLKEALKKAGFQVVQTLTEANATHQGILKKLASFTRECKPQDVVLIHFSGHGQQMPDLMRDETDTLTEAFIPYDAHRVVTSSYGGEAHLTDDEIRDKLTVLRNKLGRNGLLMVTIDACHSEGSTRTDLKTDSEEGRPVYRGTSDKFKVGKKVKLVNTLHKDACRLIELSACQAGQKNKEYRGYGRLSYILAKKISKEITFDRLASLVVNDRTIMNRKQNPQLTVHPVGNWSR